MTAHQTPAARASSPSRCGTGVEEPTPSGSSTPILCEWFAKCVRPAAGTTPHPLLGPVPICGVCAERHELPVARSVA